MVFIWILWIIYTILEYVIDVLDKTKLAHIRSTKGDKAQNQSPSQVTQNKMWKDHDLRIKK